MKGRAHYIAIIGDREIRMAWSPLEAAAAITGRLDLEPEEQETLEAHRMLVWPMGKCRIDQCHCTTPQTHDRR